MTDNDHEERIAKLEVQVAELVTVLTRQAEILTVTQAGLLKLIDKVSIVPKEQPKRKSVN